MTPRHLTLKATLARSNLTRGVIKFLLLPAVLLTGYSILIVLKYFSTTKRRRHADKVGKGLRHFSMKVCEKVRNKGFTSYNEVADELVLEFAAGIHGSGDSQVCWNFLLYLSNLAISICFMASFNSILNTLNDIFKIKFRLDSLFSNMTKRTFAEECMMH